MRGDKLHSCMHHGMVAGEQVLQRPTHPAMRLFRVAIWHTKPSLLGVRAADVPSKASKAPIIRHGSWQCQHSTAEDHLVTASVQALTGQPLTIFGDGSQTRSFQYVSDLIEGAPPIIAAAAIVLPRDPFVTCIGISGVAMWGGSFKRQSQASKAIPEATLAACRCHHVPFSPASTCGS